MGSSEQPAGGKSGGGGEGGPGGVEGGGNAGGVDGAGDEGGNVRGGMEGGGGGSELQLSSWQASGSGSHMLHMSSVRLGMLRVVCSRN